MSPQPSTSCARRPHPSTLNSQPSTATQTPHVQQSRSVLDCGSPLPPCDPTEPAFDIRTPAAALTPLKNSAPIPQLSTLNRYAHPHVQQPRSVMDCGSPLPPCDPTEPAFDIRTSATALTPPQELCSDPSTLNPQPRHIPLAFESLNPQLSTLNQPQNVQLRKARYLTGRHRLRRPRLFPHADLPGRGALRPHQPDAPRCRFHFIQPRRRQFPRVPAGLRPLRRNRHRLPFRSRVPGHHRLAPGIDFARDIRPDLRSRRETRPYAERPPPFAPLRQHLSALPSTSYAAPPPLPIHQPSTINPQPRGAHQRLPDREAVPPPIPQPSTLNPQPRTARNTVNCCSQLTLAASPRCE
jgi:hypothetical protein